MEQGPKVYTRRRRRNTPLFSTRTTSEKQQMQQSHNQVEELPRSEPTNEGQHMNQQIKSPSKFACTGKMCELVDYHILTTILPLIAGNAHDDELLHGLRRLTHVRRLARSLRQQNNGIGNNLNNGKSYEGIVELSLYDNDCNGHDDSLLNGLHRLTHVRRLARSLRHDQNTITGNSPNGGE
ncbi:hypothetical protein RHSIM_Rhsim13G0104800 [Rhododendron simsii]|uniref:Uncharacterized protein n=1 Tax=Rhododendron simsii TaxID=118357 RepID=A0A834FX52_RHOSS|nr:hypothetical protein RHSIM_Rhsim13G0104800 [Rhododendron simsii]